MEKEGAGMVKKNDEKDKDLEEETEIVPIKQRGYYPSPPHSENGLDKKDETTRLKIEA